MGSAGRYGIGKRRGKGKKGKGGISESSSCHNLSRKLSRILRHLAEEVGLHVDRRGWVDVAELLRSPPFRSDTCDLPAIRRVVETCEKKRFELWEEHHGLAWIRATQGHSMFRVDNSAHAPISGPRDLAGKTEVVHGTCLAAWMGIRNVGLKSMKRNHIHFCLGLPGSGVISGMRDSADVVISVDLARAIRAGVDFVKSTNGVILTKGSHGILSTTFFNRVEWLGNPRVTLYDRRMGDVTDSACAFNSELQKALSLAVVDGGGPRVRCLRQSSHRCVRPRTMSTVGVQTCEASQLFPSPKSRPVSVFPTEPAPKQQQRAQTSEAEQAVSSHQVMHGLEEKQETFHPILHEHAVVQQDAAHSTKESQPATMYAEAMEALDRTRFQFVEQQANWRAKVMREVEDTHSRALEEQAVSHANALRANNYTHAVIHCRQLMLQEGKHHQLASCHFAQHHGELDAAVEAERASLTASLQVSAEEVARVFSELRVSYATDLQHALAEQTAVHQARMRRSLDSQRAMFENQLDEVLKDNNSKHGHEVRAALAVEGRKFATALEAIQTGHEMLMQAQEDIYRRQMQENLDAAKSEHDASLAKAEQELVSTVLHVNSLRENDFTHAASLRRLLKLQEGIYQQLEASWLAKHQQELDHAVWAERVSFAAALQASAQEASEAFSELRLSHESELRYALEAQNELHQARMQSSLDSQKVRLENHFDEILKDHHSKYTLEHQSALEAEEKKHVFALGVLKVENEMVMRVQEDSYRRQMQEHLDAVKSDYDVSLAKAMQELDAEHRNEVEALQSQHANELEIAKLEKETLHTSSHARAINEKDASHSKHVGAAATGYARASDEKDNSLAGDELGAGRALHACRRQKRALGSFLRARRGEETSKRKEE